MAPIFVSKRPHKKSRGGCKTCKTRKVKCDEAQPKCSFCEKRDLKCVYFYTSAASLSNSATPPSLSSENASSASTSPGSGYYADVELVPQSWSLSPAPSIQIMSTAGCMSRTDLELMHHWSTATWNTINVTDQQNGVLLLHAPQLGFGNEFLLNCILGISSFHLEHLNPDSPQISLIRQQTSLYRVRALKSFREHLGNSHSSLETWEASLLTSILLVVLCSKEHVSPDGDLAVVNWIVLYRGLASVIMMRSYVDVQRSNVASIFKREFSSLRTAPVIPQLLIDMVEKIKPLDSDFEYLEWYCKAIDVLGILYAGLRQDGVTPALFVRIVSWPSFLSEQFGRCAQEKRPRSLIILAYYLVFTKLVNGLWWLDGSSNAQINAIEEMIGPEWLVYMRLPLEATYLSKPEEITDLLLR
ncbi:Sterol uptake control protein [Lachnellula occidentalis]|uniref:Sterol uptake control protein n=1 Tax=Lachnellula occidentalis TaxID=215460 RepID=A0A8H8RDF5_9HELO|nr:Sterol uptake control protein [Lachnellula occidentalis]